MEIRLFCGESIKTYNFINYHYHGLYLLTDLFRGVSIRIGTSSAISPPSGTELNEGATVEFRLRGVIGVFKLGLLGRSLDTFMVGN